MDFEKLCEILPKHPKEWDQEEVSKWLKFIRLEKYVDSFS
jgi:hypothetical protein